LSSQSIVSGSWKYSFQASCAVVGNRENSSCEIEFGICQVEASKSDATHQAETLQESFLKVRAKVLGNSLN